MIYGQMQTIPCLDIVFSLLGGFEKNSWNPLCIYVLSKVKLPELHRPYLRELYPCVKF